MHYNKNALEGSATVGYSRRAKDHGSVTAVGALTTYKKVVDIENDEDYSFYDECEIKHYGLSNVDLKEVHRKLKRQKDFLNSSFLFDRISNKRIPLSQVVISAYHSPDRYYAEIQNRVHTLELIANQRDLEPLFMTLTLPSEYHKYKTTKNGTLTKNPKYNGLTPKDSVKVLTKYFARLRQDRSLKNLSKEERIYFRVNEPHKDGTPHTHILMFLPKEAIPRVIRAYKRLYDDRANDIQIIRDDINNSVAYVMKYVNKVLPLSKKKNLTQKEMFLNAWYSKHRVVRFNCSKTLAPLSLYRLLHNKFTMLTLTKLVHQKSLDVYVAIDTNKVMEIFDGDEVIYTRNDNFNVELSGDNSQNYSQASDSASGVAA